MPKCKHHHELSIELANHHRPNPFKVNEPGPPLPDQAFSEQRPPVQGVMPPVQKGLETLSDMPKFMTINNVLEKSLSHTPSAGWVAVNHSRPDGSEDRIGNLQLVELNNDDDYKGMRPEGTDVPDEDEPTVEEEDQSPVSSSLKSFNGLC